MGIQDAVEIPRQAHRMAGGAAKQVDRPPELILGLRTVQERSEARGIRGGLRDEDELPRRQVEARQEGRDVHHHQRAARADEVHLLAPIEDADKPRRDVILLAFDFSVLHWVVLLHICADTLLEVLQGFVLVGAVLVVVVPQLHPVVALQNDRVVTYGLNEDHSEWRSVLHSQGRLGSCVAATGQNPFAAQSRRIRRVEYGHGRLIAAL
mmetsp:Transcript_97964/g.281825  ORF Transcript_97964/g.281825 Transcript_97964/m.281825 type:complete len:209 (+) Transcript_97964:516-1142(+)